MVALLTWARFHRGCKRAGVGIGRDAMNLGGGVEVEVNLPLVTKKWMIHEEVLGEERSGRESSKGIESCKKCSCDHHVTVRPGVNPIPRDG